MLCIWHCLFLILFPFFFIFFIFIFYFIFKIFFVPFILIDSPGLAVIDGLLVWLRFNFLPAVEYLFVILIHNRIKIEILLNVQKMLKVYNIQSGVLHGVYHTSNLKNEHISDFYIQNLKIHHFIKIRSKIKILMKLKIITSPPSISSSSTIGNTQNELHSSTTTELEMMMASLLVYNNLGLSSPE